MEHRQWAEILRINIRYFPRNNRQRKSCLLIIIASECRCCIHFLHSSMHSANGRFSAICGSERIKTSCIGRRSAIHYCSISIAAVTQIIVLLLLRIRDSRMNPHPDSRLIVYACENTLCPQHKTIRDKRVYVYPFMCDICRSLITILQIVRFESNNFTRLPIQSIDYIFCIWTGKLNEGAATRPTSTGQMVQQMCPHCSSLIEMDPEMKRESNILYSTFSWNDFK